LPLHGKGRRFKSGPAHHTLSPAVSDVINHALDMQREGYRPSTIESQVSALKAIAHHANLHNPDDVKEYLARLGVTESRKEALVIRLNRFYKWKGINWTPPRYRRIEKLPFIPLETEVDQLIAGTVNVRICCFLQLLKETGIRPGEAWQLQWVDLNGNILTVTPEKNSNPRQFKINDKLAAMLNVLPRKSDYIFRPTKESELRHFRRVYIQQRRSPPTKLQNPRIMKIAFKTLRHFKATMEYHKTKDILHVMQLLGHKNIRNTLVYTHLVNFESDDYVCKVAKAVGEAKALVEDGFDYVCDVEGHEIFRKRK
jgi:integrase